MSDNFFGFDTTLGRDALDVGLLSDEDEEHYDALNDETFGDAIISDDWEQDHEKLAEAENTELGGHNFMSENEELSAKMAAFILDDDQNPDDNDFELRPRRPPPGFSNSSNDNNVFTVEEVERSVVKQPVELKKSLRVEDLERNLILPKQQLVPNQWRIQPPPPGQLPQRHIANNLGDLKPPIPIQLPRPVLMYPGASANRVGAPGGPLNQSGLGLSNLAFLRLHGRGLPTTNVHNFPKQQNQNHHHPPVGVPGDEYAGLMTAKEKHWLASIQLLQLNTTQPFHDDYYYIMRQCSNHGRKIGNSLKNAREPLNLNKPIYTPLQFENVLGKLQVGSVMAPRKIIDTEVVESAAECSNAVPSSRKVKQILLEIEQMFSNVLNAEEALSPLSTLSVEEVNPNKVFSKIVNILIKDDKLQTVLNIRKGKALVLRVLPHTEVSLPLAHKLITLLPMAAKRDPEQSFLRALPAIRHFLATCSLQVLADLAESFQLHLSFLLPNKFGISVITNMIERAETLVNQGSVCERWLNFIGILLTECINCELERPVVGIPKQVLAQHLLRSSKSNGHNIGIMQKAMSNLTIEKDSNIGNRSTSANLDSSNTSN